MIPYYGIGLFYTASELKENLNQKEFCMSKLGYFIGGAILGAVGYAVLSELDREGKLDELELDSNHIEKELDAFNQELSRDLEELNATLDATFEEVIDKVTEEEYQPLSFEIDFGIEQDQKA